MKLNTGFDVCFSLVHEGEPEDIPFHLLIEAARRRLDRIEKEVETEAIGIIDSYEEPEDQKDAFVKHKITGW